MKWGSLLLPFCCFCLSACQPDLGLADCERTPDMPTGLKMAHYRGATPACVPDGITLNVTELQTLLQRPEPPVLIDVWAILLRQEAGFPSVWLPNEAHESLPKAVWLPNVGYGELAPEIETYLQTNLQRLSGDDKHKPLVFFCVADCWMSWNTVQRVRQYGYTQVYWFKDGTDGWAEAGLPLEQATPVPMDAL